MTLALPLPLKDVGGPGEPCGGGGCGGRPQFLGTEAAAAAAAAVSIMILGGCGRHSSSS